MQKISNPTRTTKNNNISLFIIFVLTLFMSVGYASINNVILGINGLGSIAAEDSITTTSPVEAGYNYTISCPTFSDNNGKWSVTRFEFLINP